MLDIYGGTVKLFEDVLRAAALRCASFLTRTSATPRYFTSKTRMLFLETLTNPTLRCADIATLSAIAHRRKACVSWTIRSLLGVAETARTWRGHRHALRDEIS